MTITTKKLKRINLNIFNINNESYLSATRAKGPTIHNKYLFNGESPRDSASQFQHKIFLRIRSLSTDSI